MKPESTVSVADALFTRPLIDDIYSSSTNLWDLEGLCTKIFHTRSCPDFHFEITFEKKFTEQIGISNNSFLRR